MEQMRCLPYPHVEVFILALSSQSDHAPKPDGVRALSASVGRMLDRRARMLFGKPFSECNQLCQDICLASLNAALHFSGMAVTIERAPRANERKTQPVETAEKSANNKGNS